MRHILCPPHLLAFSWVFLFLCILAAVALPSTYVVVVSKIAPVRRKKRMMAFVGEASRPIDRGGGRLEGFLLEGGMIVSFSEQHLSEMRLCFRLQSPSL